LGDWLFDAFYKPRYEAQYRQYMQNSQFLKNYRPTYPLLGFGDLMSNQIPSQNK
jgi:hypothetical protein